MTEDVPVKTRDITLVVNGCPLFKGNTAYLTACKKCPHNKALSFNRKLTGELVIEPSMRIGTVQCTNLTKRERDMLPPKVEKGDVRSPW